MAAVTTQKCSVRRTILRRVATLVDQLIQVNEAADRTRVQMLAAGVSDANIKLAVDKILAAGGPLTGTDGSTALAEADELAIVNQLVNMLNGTQATTTIYTAADTRVGWQYLAE